MARTGPLSGVRIIDLTIGWAGPVACRIMGDLGADVIWVEPPQPRTLGMEATAELARKAREGWRRGQLPSGPIRPVLWPDLDPGERPGGRQVYRNMQNRSKRNITLDLKSQQGRELFLRLAAISDAVVENFSPGMMARLSLDYPDLKRVNPGISLISLPGFGKTGPYKDYVSWGTVLEAAVGLQSLNGYPNGGPMRCGWALPDANGAITGAMAALMALWHRRRTGEGQYVDLSQAEALLGTLGEAVVAYQLTGQLPPRRGNRDDAMAPHGAYPCQGEDSWIAIAVARDAEWEALRGVMGDPDWARDERFATQLGRWKHQDELDGCLAKWTRGFEHRELMQKLQAAGVPAGAVLNTGELLDDPHLRERQFYFQIVQPAVGYPQPNPGLPVKFSECSPDPHPTPMTGEHNTEVLQGLLGLSDSEVRELRDAGVIAKTEQA